MRVVFIGRSNRFNRKFVTELFKEHELLCCLFVELELGSKSFILKRFKKRAKKYGWLKAVDEMAFQLYHRYYLSKRKDLEFKKKQPDYFLNDIPIDIPCYDVENVHSPEWMEFIKEQKPDIIFSICCNVIFRPKLFNIPRLGTYVLHEGITPEYKGLHTPIWAMLNKEHQYLGYTILKVDKSIDGGGVLLQDIYELKDGEDAKAWSWVGHNALIEGMPKMKVALANLEKNSGFKPLDTDGRKSGNFTWVGLTTFLRKA